MYFLINLAFRFLYVSIYVMKTKPCDHMNKLIGGVTDFPPLTPSDTHSR